MNNKRRDSGAACCQFVTAVPRGLVQSLQLVTVKGAHVGETHRQMGVCEPQPWPPPHPPLSPSSSPSSPYPSSPPHPPSLPLLPSTRLPHSLIFPCPPPLLSLSSSLSSSSSSSSPPAFPSLPPPLLPIPPTPSLSSTFLLSPSSSLSSYSTSSACWSGLGPALKTCACNNWSAFFLLLLYKRTLPK